MVVAVRGQPPLCFTVKTVYHLIVYLDPLLKTHHRHYGLLEASKARAQYIKHDLWPKSYNYKLKKDYKYPLWDHYQGMMT